MDAYMLDSFIGIFTTVVLIIAVALAVVVVILFKNRQQLEEKEKERDNDRHIRDMMLDSVSEFVMVFDRKLDILWINEPGAAFLMKPSEKIIGSNLHRIPVIFEKEGLEKNLREALKKRRIYTDTLDLIQGASRIPHHVTIQRYLSGDREVFLFTASNIRKEIEEDSFRKGQREKITEIESLGKLGYWELSNESRQVTWSRGLYTILGYDLNSIRPNLDFMYRMVLPEDQNASNRAFVAAFQDQKPVDQMLRIRNNQGEELRIILRIRHSFDRENNLVSTMGFMQDITEVISLENSLSYERNLSKAILDHSDILVFVTDSSGAIVLVNSYLQKLVGLDEKELIGKQAEDYFGGVTRESMNRFSKTHYFEGMIEMPDTQFGDRFVRWSLSRFSTLNGNELMICVGIDLTQSEISRKRLEYKANFIQETKLPNKQKFSAEISRYFTKNKYREDRTMVLANVLIRNAADISCINGRDTAVKLISTEASRLKRSLGPDILLGHDGADMFSVFLPNRTQQEVDSITEQVARDLGESIRIRGRDYDPRVFIGYSCYPGEARTLAQLVHNADSAVGEAARSGRKIVKYTKQEKEQTEVVSECQ